MPQTSKKVRPFSQVNSILETVLYNDISDQLRSYEYAQYIYIYTYIYIYILYVHVCKYTLSASLRARALVLSDSASLKNPTGKLVERESRDGGFHEVTALSQGSNAANRSEFPPIFLSGFLRFFLRNVPVFGSELGSTRCVVRCLFSQLNKNVFQVSSKSTSTLKLSSSQVLAVTCHKYCDQYSILCFPTFKSQGLSTCFSKQHGLNKSPPYHLSHPFSFVSPLVSVYWSTYHTVRKPVRRTPNKDECPRRQKRCVRFLK